MDYKWKKISQEEAAKIIETSQSYREASHKLGYKNNNIESIQKMCDFYHLDCSHFLGQRKYNNLQGQKFGRLTVKEKTEKRSGRHIVWRCQCDCGTIIEVSSNQLLRNKTQSCGCYHKEIISNNLIGQRFGFLLVIAATEQRTNRGQIIWKCKCDCGNICEKSTDALVSGNTSSCGCKQFSRGEEKIASLLQKANIDFVRQKTFEDCYILAGHLLSFDFWVQNSYCIEFDGEQHFRPVDFFGGEERFQRQKEYDLYKDEYCFINNIPLIRIPFTKLKTLELKDLQVETTDFLIRKEK